MLITFLLSAFNRPSTLLVSLGSLINQTSEDWECWILCNHPSQEMFDRHCDITISDPRIHIARTFDPSIPAWDCYWAAEEWASIAKGKWLAFPSDDSYLCPEFIERMTEDDSMDLAYCNVLYDKRMFGKRAILNVEPRVCAIDKTCFIVKREKFIGFPGKNTDYSHESTADGYAVERMVGMGYKHRKVEECLVVHN